ncbi:thiol reductant ABC exporter subunit CydC [Propionicimonas sp.]|uniref:thiol reductant ABC exporter subunit CydC n=1 Tax=Propionicimonas sp. TaxID=1955623 RepID=UPI003A5212F4
MESVGRTGNRGSLLHRVFAAVPGARARLVGAVLLSFLATGASVALMATSGWLLSRAAEHPPVLYLSAAATLVRAFGISRGGFRYVERLASHEVALRLQSALRLETYATLARTTLLGRRRGDLLSRVIADVEAIQDLVVRVWIPFASAALVVLVTSAALAVLSPASAGVLLLSALLAGLVVPELARRVSRKDDSALAGLRGDLADAVHELSHAATDLVAYDAADTYLARFTATDARLRGHEGRAARVQGLAEGFQSLAAGLAVTGALWFGGHQVASGTLPPVMLAVLTLTPLALHEALGALAQAAQTATRARTALRRVEAVLDAEPVGSGDVPAVLVTDVTPHLTLTGLDAGWPGEPPVVRGLDLAVAPGEKVALVGPSGVGKTTVAATILGLIDPQGGSLELAGRPGYLAQDAHIFGTTIAENVRIGNRDATDADITRALLRAGLGGLAPSRLVGEGGTALSGGEARRLALSRLFVGDYQVLVLDEPTEHLDAPTATALADDLWASSADVPVLVLTHDPALVARCDRVVELSGPPAA